MGAPGTTPGPWFVSPLSAQIEVPDRDAPICQLLWPTDLRSEDETFANARQMAASGDLYDALAGIMARLDRGHNAPGHCHTVSGIWDSDNAPGIAGRPCEWCAHWQRARAALSRARTLTDGDAK